jgi:hypothetical protein
MSDNVGLGEISPASGQNGWVAPHRGRSPSSSTAPDSAGVGAVAFLAITSAIATWRVFMPRGWLRRLAERFEAKGSWA